MKKTPAAVLALSFLVACSSPSGGGPVVASGRGRVTATVDRRGGTLILEGEAELRVPAMALDRPVSLEMESLASKAVEPPTQVERRLSKPLAVRPHGQGFAEPVELEIRLDPADVADVRRERVAVLRLENEQAKSWRPVDGASRNGFNGESPRVVLRTDRFSVYMAVLLAEATEDAGADSAAPSTDGGAGTPTMDAGGDAAVDARVPPTGDATTPDGSTDGSTDMSTDGSTDADQPVSPLSSQPVWPTHADFNAWVRHPGGARHEAADVACDPSVDAECSHGGAYRQVTLNGFASCSGVVITDDLDAFVWGCFEDTNPPRAVSLGLNPDRPLRDLIDWSAAPVWRAVTVTASNGPTVRSTDPEVWWTNPLIADPAPPLDATGAVYAITANSSFDYTLAGDRVALIGGPSVVLGGANAGATLLNDGGRDFAWIEADVDAALDNTALLLDGRHGRVRRSELRNATTIGLHLRGERNYIGQLSARDCQTGIEVNGAAGSRVEESEVLDSLGVGVNAATAADTQLQDVQVLRAGSTGVVLGGTANVISGLTVVSSQSDGLTVSGSDHMLDRLAVHNNNLSAGSAGIFMDASRSRVSHVHVSNNEEGLAVGSDGDDNVFVDIVASGNLSAGFLLTLGRSNVFIATTSVNNGFGYTMGTNDRIFSGFAANNASAGHNSTRAGGMLYDFASIDNTGGSVGFGSSATGSGIFGELVVTDAGANCSDAGAAIFTSACVGSGFTTSEATTAPSFVGPLATADGSNADGAAVLAVGSITDWSQFDSVYRAWNRSGAFSGARERCETGDCQIHDFRLRSSAGAVFDSLSAPLDGTADHVSVVWSESLAPGCATIAGATFTNPGCVSDVLRRAYEVFDDGVGNDNGLCESGETCVRLRNHGAYQGEGSPVPVQGSFVDGIVTGVTLLESPTNGL